MFMAGRPNHVSRAILIAAAAILYLLGCGSLSPLAFSNAAGIPTIPPATIQAVLASTAQAYWATTPTLDPPETPTPALLPEAAAAPQDAFTLTPTPAPTPPPTPTPEGEWYAEYYNNRDLAPPPAVVRREHDLDSTWSGAPFPGMLKDHFSAVFTRTANFPTTDNYIFTLVVDDGAQVYVDNLPLINEWRYGKSRTVRGYAVLEAGDHQITVRYFDGKGRARIKLSWGPGYVGWQGRVYGNINLNGPVLAKRDDHHLDLAWGAETPVARDLSENYSIDWTRKVKFPCSCEYEFTVVADDEARVYIDGGLEPLVDNFGRGGPATLTARKRLSAGYHFMQAQFVQRGGGAAIKLNWKPMAPFPPGTNIPVTWTPAATPDP